VRTYLGVDGGGSKTRFALIDETGRVLARHEEGPAYYHQIGLPGLEAMLERGIAATLEQAGVKSSDLSFAYLGLPAYGEDSQLVPTLDAAASGALPQARYRCGNDMVCGWAGALACEDGINVVAGTGSIAYGEYRGRSARAGGWGELFSDEGSAYWIAREGLALFSRMSDGRVRRGPLHGIVRAHFSLGSDLDLCAAIYGAGPAQRSEFAALARLVAQAATAGDAQAQALFGTAARELAAIVDAVRSQLQVPDEITLPVSYTGGMFQLADLLLGPLRVALGASSRSYHLAPPRLSPEAGAAVYAAKLSGVPLNSEAVAALAR